MLQNSLVSVFFAFDIPPEVKMSKKDLNGSTLISSLEYLETHDGPGLNSCWYLTVM